MRGNRVGQVDGDEARALVEPVGGKEGGRDIADDYALFLHQRQIEFHAVEKQDIGKPGLVHPGFVTARVHLYRDTQGRIVLRDCVHETFQMRVSIRVEGLVRQHDDDVDVAHAAIVNVAERQEPPAKLDEPGVFEDVLVDGYYFSRFQQLVHQVRVGNVRLADPFRAPDDQGIAPPPAIGQLLEQRIDEEAVRAISLGGMKPYRRPRECQ